MFLAIVANLLLTFAALGLGSLLLSLVPKTFPALDRFALILLGGLGLFGTLLFDVGLIRLSRTEIVLIVLLGAILGFRLFSQEARKIDTNVFRITLPGLPAAIVIGVVLVTALGGLAEPTGDMENDSIAYHYLGPKVWLREGVIRPVLDQSYTAFPATVETSYAALMSLGGQRAPQFFAVTALSSILLVAAGLAMRLGADISGAWWAAALVAAMPAVYRGAYGGFNDVMYAGFVLGAARIGFDAEKTSHYALFGMFCGFAMGTKYTGLIACTLLVFGVFVILFFSRGQEGGIVLRRLAIGGAIAAVVACPVYIRNWILLGCPIYPPPPLLPEYFHVRYLPPEGIKQFHDYIIKRGQGMGRGPLSFLLLPFNLTYHTANFNGAGGIGLAPLALAPFGVIACRRDHFAQGLALLSLMLTAAWFVTEQESRFLIPVYVMGAIFAVLGWRYAVRAAPRFAPTLAGLVVACSILYGLDMIAPSRIDDLRAVVSKSFAEQRREKEIPFLESFDYLNREDSVSSVLILDRFVPGYYSDKNYIKPVGVFDEQSVPDAANLQEMLKELPSLKVSHILDVQFGGRNFRLPENPQGLTLVFERENQRVYRVD